MLGNDTLNYLYCYNKTAYIFIYSYYYLAYGK